MPPPKSWSRPLASALIAAAFGAPLRADTTSYSYDALGRLVEVFNTKTGYRDKYVLDAADNRANVEARDVFIQLNANQSVYSPDGRFRLVMQTDGNLVLYGPSGALWSSQTNGTNATFAAMQVDGNLVVYTATGQPLWASGTSGHPASELDVQSDGNVVIYSDAMVPLWSTGTGGH